MSDDNEFQSSDAATGNVSVDRQLLAGMVARAVGLTALTEVGDVWAGRAGLLTLNVVSVNNLKRICFPYSTTTYLLVFFHVLIDCCHTYVIFCILIVSFIWYFRLVHCDAPLITGAVT